MVAIAASQDVRIVVVPVYESGSPKEVNRQRQARSACTVDVPARTIPARDKGKALLEFLRR